MLQEFLELTAGRRRNIVERAERPGREQRIAGAPEHAGSRGLLCQEAADERSLADACFAADQDDTTTVLPDHRCEPLRQLGKLLLAFEQTPPSVSTSIVHLRSPHRATP